MLVVRRFPFAVAVLAVSLLGAVDVPRLDGEDQRALWLGPVGGVDHLGSSAGSSSTNRTVPQILMRRRFG